MPSSVMTPLNNRQVCKLMRSWGFEEAGGSGGHIIMRHKETDQRVQVTAPGRKTPTPQTALRKAAQIVGVPLADFKAGPPQPEKKPRVELKPIDLSGAEVRGEGEVKLNGNGNGNGKVNGHQPVPEAEPEPEPEKRKRRQPQKEILELLRGAPNICFKTQDICDRTGLKSSAVSQAIRPLMEKTPEIKKVGYGTYKWDQPAPVEDERTVEAVMEEAMRRQRTFEKVTADTHGRVVLRDADGELWVAIRVEPTFFPVEQPLPAAVAM